MKKSNVIIIIIMSVIILGLCAFIAYDKNLLGSKGNNTKKSNDVVDNKDSKTTIKKIDINDDLVKNLVYPKMNSEVYGSSKSFVLKEEYASSYALGNKIIASLEKHTSEDVGCYYVNSNGDLISLTPKDGIEKWSCSKISEDVVKNDLKKTFGPDFNYILDKDMDLGSTYCGYLRYYDFDSKAFYGVNACGGAGTFLVNPVLKTYKAELDGDYLYVYDYALINFIQAKYSNEIFDLITRSLLFDDFDAFKNYYDASLNGTETMDGVIKENKFYLNGNTINDLITNAQEAAQEYLEELINSNKAKTYIWTFKKQSDGKYYYYSSNWQK